MGITLLTLGLLLLALGYYLYRRAQQWMATAQTATGQIMELQEKESTDSEGDTTVLHYPVVRFQYGNQWVEFRNALNVNPARFPVGTTTTVWYNPQRPEDARVDARSGNLVGPLTCAVMGLLLIGLSTIDLFSL